MAGARDKLIHDHFGIDYDIVWDIIQNKIPDLDHLYFFTFMPTLKPLTPSFSILLMTFL